MSKLWPWHGSPGRRDREDPGRSEIRVPIRESGRFSTRCPVTCSSHNYGALANWGASKFMLLNAVIM
jgi:hypothetical protein